MRHEEGFFQGIRNTRIYHQCWLPDGEARAVQLLASIQPDLIKMVLSPRDV